MARKSIRFQLWKASTGKVYNLSANREITFAHGFVYGCGDQEPVVFTAGESEMQTIVLNKGWNWISTHLEVTASLRNAITAEQPWSEGDLIKNPATRQFCSYSEGSDQFVGTLNKLHHTKMYMVSTARDNSMHIFGNKLKEDSMQITLRGDGQWNEMPCLYDQVTLLRDALSDYYDNASAGDIIKSHTRFATFTTDKQWAGDLTVLTPGEGYLFRRMASGPVTVKFHKRRTNIPKRTIAPTDAFLNPQAATNMTMIAKINAEGNKRFGEALNSEALHVYVAGERAAVATPIMIDNEAYYFLTIQSDKLGELRFETEDGQVLTPKRGAIRYAADSHAGSIKEPILLQIDGETRPYKIIENDHVVIIKNNEKYDVTGKKL